MIFGVFDGLVTGGYMTVTGIIDIWNIIQGGDGSIFWAVIKIVGVDFVAIIIMLLSWVGAMGLMND